ncbi:hypothetical protein EAE96_005259 [Botrytis aclada]|nr:hypothetical protein EAE96_005259 [Botrytis aclada]
MVYIRKKLRNSMKPDFANAHKGHLRALEKERRESAKRLIEACKKAEAVSQAEKEARRVVAEAAAIAEASQPKLSRKEARTAAAKAAKEERRLERQTAEAKTAEANTAEVTRLLANDALQLARRMYALRLRDPRVGGDCADVNEEEDEYDDYGEQEEPETLEEFKTRVLGWYGLCRKRN